MKNIMILCLLLSLAQYSFAQIPTCPHDNFGGNNRIAISTITPQIHTNHNIGEAPLYVYVSAFQTTATGSSNPFADVEYTWDFGDNSAMGNYTFTHPIDASTMPANTGQSGPEAAYLYKIPGTYTITLTARAWNGSGYITNSTTTAITVNAWLGQDRYFDPTTGNDTNDGLSPATAWQTWGNLATWLNGGDNRRAFIKRGESMPVTSTLASKRSGLRIEAYDVGAKPLLVATAAITAGQFIFINGTSASINDHYYANIDFDANGIAGAVYFGYTDNTGFLNHAIFDNCDFRNGGSSALVLTTGSGPKQSLLLWDCNLYGNVGDSHNVYTYLTPYFTVIGGYQDGGNAHPLLDHQMYINEGDHTLIRWLRFGPSINRNFCLNMNAPSDGSDFEYTLIDGCDITGTNNGIDFSNTNNNDAGHFSKVIVQNCAIHDLNSLTQGIGILGYSIKDLCLRFNRFYNNRLNDLDIRDSDNIYSVYHNSFYVPATWPHTAVLIRTGQQGAFLDNIFVNEAAAGNFHYSGNLATTVNWNIDYNQYWHPSIPSPFFETTSSSNLTFAQWQTLGYDLNGQVNDPLFPHPVMGDFGQLPTADFNYTHSGLDVNFNNLSSNNPTHYTWDFGDASPMDNTANPMHTYSSNGTYLASLSATNACGTDTHSETIMVNSNEASLELNVKAFLQGTFDTGTGLMYDDLRSAGLLPITDPYGLGQNISSSVFAQTGNDAIVDWMLLELRDTASPNLVAFQQAVLLQRDGDVVARDGVSAVQFLNVPMGNYHIALRHRNHLGVMTNLAIQVN